MDLRYPIGPFSMEKGPFSEEQRRLFIDQMAETPQRLTEAVAGLSAEQLDTPYRPDGWREGAPDARPGSSRRRRAGDGAPSRGAASPPSKPHRSRRNGRTS